MHPMLNIAVRAARNAGNVIMKAYEHLDNVQVTQKSLNDYVTNVDQEAERVIIDTIRKFYPDHGILGEEGGEHSAKNCDYQWILDPLDGTTNFTRGIPHFAVSIALHVKGKAEQAVVFDPVRNELFTASRGAGAQLNGYRIRVSKARDLKGALLATGFPFKSKQHLHNYQNIFAGLFADCGDMRRAGAASLDLAYVAAGRLDGYWEIGLKPWDLAAGELLVRESGGLVTDFVGGYNYFKSGNTVAANARVMKDLLAKMREHLGEALSR